MAGDCEMAVIAEGVETSSEAWNVCRSVLEA